MNINEFYCSETEKPLDRLVSDGGFCGIFRKIGVIGDSLSSGEFESKSEGITGFHDYYEYSWGQYIARAAGCKVFNFSRGGMTAEVFFNDFYSKCGVFENENLCQAYIIALGVNDLNRPYDVGCAKDAATSWPDEKNPTILGYYGGIIRRIKQKQPQAKIFLMTIPMSEGYEEEKLKREEALCEGIREFADIFQNIYIIDLRKYAPVYDQKFRDTFFLGHMTATGYMLTAKMVMSYIDYYIRKYPKDFQQVGFIGTPYKYE